MTADEAPAGATSRLNDLLYLQRYAFAEQFVGANSGVLDYRCDGAFGAVLLSNRAAHVTGICDTAAAADLLRSSHTDLGNVSFFGPLSYLPELGERAFDLVTCFDLAVLTDFTAAVEQLRQFDRLLRPDGVLLLALPGDDQDLAARLRTHLRKSFRWVRAYQQSGQASSLLADWPLDRSDPRSGAVSASMLRFADGRASTRPAEPGRAAAIILVAAGAPLPSGGMSVLLDAPELATPSQRSVDDESELRAQVRQLQEQNRLLERHNRILAAAAQAGTSPSPARSGTNPVSLKQRLKHRYWSFERLVYNALSPRWRTRIARLRRSVLTRLGKGF